MGTVVLDIFGVMALPIGPRVSQAAALALIGYGAFVVFVPEALPTASRM